MNYVRCEHLHDNRMSHLSITFRFSVANWKENEFLLFGVARFRSSQRAGMKMEQNCNA